MLILGKCVKIKMNFNLLLSHILNLILLDIDYIILIIFNDFNYFYIYVCFIQLNKL